jgi:radical SAM protein with 4Fe4S-binding SPASM domain
MNILFQFADRFKKCMERVLRGFKRFSEIVYAFRKLPLYMANSRTRLNSINDALRRIEDKYDIVDHVRFDLMKLGSVIDHIDNRINRIDERSNVLACMITENDINVLHPLIVDSPYLLHNIELTNHCPMACAICPRKKHMKRELGFMSMKLYRLIIDQLISNNPGVSNGNAGWSGLCLHHFGESLLHPSFDEAIFYAQEKGVDVGLSFNPLVLTTERAKRLFMAKPAILFACVDGFDEDSFERIRGVKNAYAKTVENALMAIEYKNKYSPKTDLRVTMIDIPIYNDEINKTCEYWLEKYGIEIYRKKFSRWNGSDRSINSMAEVDESLQSITCESPEQATMPCQTPWTYMSINWDGTVTPCCRDYNNLHILGDANNEPLMQLWNNAKMRCVHYELRHGYVFNKLCRDCERTVNRDNLYLNQYGGTL